MLFDVIHLPTGNGGKHIQHSHASDRKKNQTTKDCKHILLLLLVWIIGSSLTGATLLNAQISNPTGGGSINNPGGGGGGGGATPAAPNFSLQYNNNLTGLGGTTNTTYNPSTKTLSVGDALIIAESVRNLPRVEYDINDPAFAGGMAAAISDASGVQEAAVINAAANYAECQVLTGKTAQPGTMILPTTYGVIPLTAVRFWNAQEFRSESFTNFALLQHTTNQNFMVDGHGFWGVTAYTTSGNNVTFTSNNDLTVGQLVQFPSIGSGPTYLSGAYLPITAATPNSFTVVFPGAPAGSGATAFGVQEAISCNGTNYAPGNAQIYYHDFAISGMGAGPTMAYNRDGGIWSNGATTVTENIAQYGNGFGSQSILLTGQENQVHRVGKVGAQLLGCLAYPSGQSPYANSPAPGGCLAFEDIGLDTQGSDIYASDGWNQQHSVGVCYPNCGAIGLFAPGSRYENLFPQISDVDLLIGAQSSITNVVRADGTTRENIIIEPSAVNSILTDVIETSACTDAGLRTSYTAGTATACYGVANLAQSSTVSNVTYGTSNQFGTSYLNCQIFDAGNGASAGPNVYSSIQYYPHPTNSTNNDLKFCGNFLGDFASGQVTWSDGGMVQTTSASPNVSGINALLLTSATTITNPMDGVGGQPLYIYSNNPSGAVAPSGTLKTCSGSAETLYQTMRLFKNIGGYASGNVWQEVGGCSGGGGGGGVSGSGTVGYLPEFTGATAIGNSPIDDGVTTANTVTVSKQLSVNVSGTPSQITLTPNGTACNVASGTAALCSDTVTTGNTTKLPAAPPTATGQVLGVSAIASGVATTAWIAGGSGGGGVYTIPTLTSDYSGGSGTDNSSALGTALNACNATGITCRFFIPDGNYGFASSVAYTGHNQIEVFLSPNANLHALSSWSSGTAVGILNFSDAGVIIRGKGSFQAHGLSECVKVTSTSSSYTTTATMDGPSCDSSAGQGFDVLSSVFNLATGPALRNVNLNDLRCTTNSALACVAARQAEHVKISKIYASAPCSGTSVAANGCGGIDTQAINGLDVGSSEVTGMPYTIATGGNPIAAFHFLEVSNFSVHDNVVFGSGQATPGAVTSQGSTAGYYYDTVIGGHSHANNVQGGGIGIRCEVCEDWESQGDRVDNVSANGIMANGRLTNLVQLASLNQTAAWVTAGTNITQTIDTADFPTGNMQALVSVSGTTVTRLSGDSFLGIPAGTTVTVNGVSYVTTGTATATTLTLTTSPGTFSSTAFTSPFTGSTVETFGSGFTSGAVMTVATGASTPGAALNWPITPVTKFQIKASAAIPYGTLQFVYYAGSTAVATENLPGIPAGAWIAVPPVWTPNWGFKLRGTNVITSVAIQATANPGTGVTLKFANMEQTTPGRNIFITEPTVLRTASNAIFIQGPLDTAGIKGGTIKDWATLYNNTTCSVYCSADPMSAILVQPNKDGGEIMSNLQITGVTMSLSPGMNPYAKGIRLATSGTSFLNGGYIANNTFLGMNAVRSNTLTTSVSQDAAANNIGLHIGDQAYDAFVPISMPECKSTGGLGTPERCSIDYGSGSAGAQWLMWRNTTFTGTAGGVVQIAAGDGTTTVDHQLGTHGQSNWLLGQVDGVTATKTRDSLCIFCQTTGAGATVQVGTAGSANSPAAGKPYIIGLYGNFSANNGTAFGSMLVLPQDTPAAPAVTPTAGASSTIGYYLVGIDNQGGLSPAGATTSITTSAATLSTTAYNQISPPNPTGQGSISYYVYRDTNSIGLATGCLGQLTLGNAVIGTATSGNGQNFFFDTGQAPTTCSAGPAPTGTVQTQTGFSLVNSTSQYSSTIVAAAGMAGSHTQTMPNVTGTIPVYVEAAITSTTPGTGVTSVTCSTATCTNMSGTYQVVGGTFTTGAFINLAWPTTGTAYKCTVTQSGGTSWLGIIHGTATATGMSITSQNSISGASFNVDYSCRP